MIRIKICGITSVSQALECAGLGADAIGLVFYPPSPRFIKDEKAARICEALPKNVASVGVFVDNDFMLIMDKVKKCGLDMVQLHGVETPELVARLEKNHVRVIKAFFINKEPFFSSISSYLASACLVECAGEKLPGGNAKKWDWRQAKNLSLNKPMILAGGLSPENIEEAIFAAMPDAVDVSSGVEKSPGIKDMKLVELFLNKIINHEDSINHRKNFQIFE